jgi:hypothetical protein
LVTVGNTWCPLDLQHSLHLSSWGCFKTLFNIIIKTSGQFNAYNNKFTSIYLTIKVNNTALSIIHNVDGSQFLEIFELGCFILLETATELGVIGTYCFHIAELSLEQLLEKKVKKQ